MNTHRSLSRAVLAVVLALAVAGLPACGSSAGNGTVTVLSFWSGPQMDWFKNQVLAAFTRKTGIQVNYELDTRAIDQDLESDLQTGTQPDIAILPSPGDLEAFAQQGALYPLDSALAQQSGYDQQWLTLETAVQPSDGGRHKYALPLATSLKSVIWYDREKLLQLLGPDWTGPPTTWAQLIALTNAISAHGGTPWCMGMESTPVSGWPGTDWIEDILLHQSGPQVYQQWADGIRSWQSPEIADALAAFGDIVADGRDIEGGLNTALLTDFSNADQSMFTKQPGCYLEHSAAVNGTNEKLVPGVDYDFFPFPTINSQYANTYEVSGDFAAMFRQSPQAASLIAYLASEQAQELWVKAPNVRGLLSADRNVPLNAYPDSVTAQTEKLIRDARTLCFDASDLMPPSVTAAFYQAMLTYLSDPTYYQDPTHLSVLTGELNNSRAAAGAEPLPYQCGQ